MKYVITGGCGFIGRALSSLLLNDENNFVRVYDNLSTGKAESLSSVGEYKELFLGQGNFEWFDRYSLVVGDILNPEGISEAFSGADVVVHLAANTGVPQSVIDPIKDCNTNVIGTLNVLEGARQNGVGRFIFASSGAPLGVQNPPLHEEMAPHPASPYGASKLAGEGYCSAYFHCFGLETVVLRFGNVYGQGSEQKQSVVAKFIREAMSGETLEIYGDGSQTRDFIHISDLTEAILCATQSAGVGGEVFQIASASETTVEELTSILVEILEFEGVNVKGVINGATRQGDVLRNFSDTSKAESRLGWKSKVSLRDGLRQTVRDFL
ncbi:MAG: epimerase [Gammaproteobacteria bacterium]|nr:epimerase [Gammaproteobacteria bacterium]|tara:strand:- start:3672 stop:4643 length:972 start_codon:yes stop_codon:yes gene_type:complete